MIDSFILSTNTYLCIYKIQHIFAKFIFEKSMFYIFTDTENLLTLNVISDNKNVNGANIIIIALIR